jgi:hypothetical protein
VQFHASGLSRAIDVHAPQLNDRLSQITTAWSLLRQAHAAAAVDPQGDRQALLDRNYGAVYRYLLGATRDEEAALELFQDFAVRFLRGDFHGAQFDDCDFVRRPDCPPGNANQTYPAAWGVMF